MIFETYSSFAEVVDFVQIRLVSTIHAALYQFANKIEHNQFSKISKEIM